MKDRVTIGDTLSFDTTVEGYPASEGWVLTYRLIPRTAGDPITITAVPDDDDIGYAIQVPATVTVDWIAGDYSWASWVSYAGQVYSLATGTCKLLPDPRVAASGYDSRTDARKALDDALIAQRSWTPTQRRYRIGEREMEFNSPGDIETHITNLRAQVAREERAVDYAAGYPDRRKTLVRMNGG